VIEIRFDKVRVTQLPEGDQIEFIMTGKPHPIRCNPSHHPISWRTDVTRGAGVAWVRDNLGVEPEIISFGAEGR
jgi:hypothetical protein